MVTMLCVAVLSAAPFKAASAGIAVSGVPPERSEFYSEFVAQQMTVSGVNVITPKQVATLLGLERQRSLLGCTTDSTSCVAEIAAALGVDGVMQGEAAKLESGGFQVSLKVLWSRDGRPLTVFSGRATDEGGLLDLMGKGATLMAKDLSEGDWVRLTVSPATHTITPLSGLRTVGFGVLGAGAAGAVVGVIGLVRSNTIAGELRSGTYVSQGEAQAVANEGTGMQAMGVVGLSVGAACLATGALLIILGSPPDAPKPVAWFGPNGGGVGVAGVLP